MKRLLFVFAAFMLAVSLSAAAEKAWLRQPPPNWNDGKEGLEVAEESVFEVVHSKIDSAFDRLGSKQAILIPPSSVEWLTGRPIAPEPGKIFVLVRSEFGHGGTGAYSIATSHDGTSINIGHVSLGPPTAATRSVLLVQLKKLPKTVYSSVGFAG